MATKSWNQFYVLCPFFLYDDGKREICCEGVHDACNVCLRFKDRQDYRIQIDTFCKDHYQNCEIYRAAMEKYAEG